MSPEGFSMSIPLLDGAVAAVYPFVADLAAAVTPVGAIVLCTAALRLLLLPLTRAAVRGERSRAALAPRVAELRRRYGRDPVRLGTELSELYRSAGTSPLAGFLPVLLQTPAFVVWYRIFTAPLLAGGHPLVFLPLLVLLALLGWVAARRARRVAIATGTPPPRGVLSLLPYARLLAAPVTPLAPVVSLVTTLTWTAIENVALRRGLPAP